MGIFDEIDKAMKKVGQEVEKADLDRHFRNIGDGINKAGTDIAAEINKATAPSPQKASGTSDTASVDGRKPHPGYTRIAAWVKTRYKGKIPSGGDPYQLRLELEQFTAEATSGLSAKTRKGFLDYIKSQDYEQLLK